jgi:hypothetical protein
LTASREPSSSKLVRTRNTALKLSCAHDTHD